MSNNRRAKSRKAAHQVIREYRDKETSGEVITEANKLVYESAQAYLTTKKSKKPKSINTQ